MSYEAGKKVEKTVTEEFDTSLPLESSKIDVDLDLLHRQKGLLVVQHLQGRILGCLRIS